jgi:hypothetical protein
MGNSLSLEDFAAKGNATSAERTAETGRIESVSMEDDLAAARKAVQKLKWIGLKDEARAIEMLMIWGERRSWNW